MWSPVVLSPLRLAPTLPILERPTQAIFETWDRERRVFLTSETVWAPQPQTRALWVGLSISELTPRALPCRPAPQRSGSSRTPGPSRGAWTLQVDLVHFGARKRAR